MRLGVSDRAGTAPLGRALASQPTLSRVAAALGKGKNAKVLRDGLARFAGWRIRAMNHGRLPKRLVIDLDSLPAEVHGRQPGSEWNGYYRARVYHPLVASVGETGDLLDVRLRRGAAHTAEGGLGFIVEVLDRAELFLCEKAADLAFRRPGHGRGTPGDVPAARQGRGPHGRADERVVNPALSSSPRPKRHYRGRPVENPGPGIDAFACNEARLLLAVFGYQIMHAQRAVLERATGTGWSLRRLLERVLRAPARFTVSGRRIAMIASAASRHWHLLVRQLQLLPGPAG